MLSFLPRWHHDRRAQIRVQVCFHLNFPAALSPRGLASVQQLCVPEDNAAQPEALHQGVQAAAHLRKSLPVLQAFESVQFCCFRNKHEKDSCNPAN